MMLVVMMTMLVMVMMTMVMEKKKTRTEEKEEGIMMMLGLDSSLPETQSWKGTGRSSEPFNSYSSPTQRP